jgi:hypothetical protein
MLLRVAAVAATGALVGACTSASSATAGFVTEPDGASEPDCSAPGSFCTPGCACGIVYTPPDTSDADPATAHPCGGFCGTIALPTEAGVDAEGGPDSGADAAADSPDGAPEQ